MLQWTILYEMKQRKLNHKHIAPAIQQMLYPTGYCGAQEKERLCGMIRDRGSETCCAVILCLYCHVMTKTQEYIFSFKKALLYHTWFGLRLYICTLYTHTCTHTNTSKSIEFWDRSLVECWYQNTFHYYHIEFDVVAWNMVSYQGFNILFGSVSFISRNK